MTTPRVNSNVQGMRLPAEAGSGRGTSPGRPRRPSCQVPGPLRPACRHCSAVSTYADQVRGSTRPRTFSLAFSRSSRSYSDASLSHRSSAGLDLFDKTVAVDHRPALRFLLQVRHHAVRHGLEVAAEASLAGLVLERPHAPDQAGPTLPGPCRPPRAETTGDTNPGSSGHSAREIPPMPVDLQVRGRGSTRSGWSALGRSCSYSSLLPRFNSESRASIFVIGRIGTISQRLARGNCQSTESLVPKRAFCALRCVTPRLDRHDLQRSPTPKSPLRSP